MKIHLDTDVIIDVIAERQPWYDSSAGVLDWAERHPGKASIAWHSLANLFYITRCSREFAVALCQFLHLPGLDNHTFSWAMSLPLSDPEDAMQVACASKHGAEFIVTRNLKHYTESPIPALSPEAFLRQNA